MLGIVSSCATVTLSLRRMYNNRHQVERIAYYIETACNAVTLTKNRFTRSYLLDVKYE